MSSITVHEMMQLLTRLCEVWGMTAGIKQTKRVAVTAGLGALFGGMLGGPVGIAVGASLGGLLGTKNTGEFKPIRLIIREMPPEKQEQLCKIAFRVIRDMEWPNAAQLMNLIMEDVAIQEQLVGVVMDYLANELKAEIKFDKTKP
ncbi:protein C19orf12 homolog [Lacerta agilis]|uniref:protein C19orf12 homolog n=1 Tax=Lacerta agilis TaxID=80427 RepID=UPI0014192882|nr:protein C19orf12 homolog [Lacerta agilis]XP_033012593.1 protein C19orf12 homolog [Lacerta agilis]XP_033012594.1 protein C19orf12 homolog [Lacerta agilis]